MKKLTEDQKDSKQMIKDLIKKPKNLYPKMFSPGNIVMFSYNPKNNKNPYDATPLAFILGKSKYHIHAINWNWIHPVLRKGIMGMILKANKKNIEKELPLKIPKMLVKKILRMGFPAYRIYIKNRISKKGILIPYIHYPKLIELRSESFIGISSEDAWKIAVKKIKKNKKRVKR